VRLSLIFVASVVETSFRSIPWSGGSSLFFFPVSFCSFPGRRRSPRSFPDHRGLAFLPLAAREFPPNFSRASWSQAPDKFTPAGRGPPFEDSLFSPAAVFRSGFFFSKRVYCLPHSLPPARCPSNSPQPASPPSRLRSTCEDGLPKPFFFPRVFSVVELSIDFFLCKILAPLGRFVASLTSLFQKPPLLLKWEPQPGPNSDQPFYGRCFRVRLFFVDFLTPPPFRFCHTNVFRHRPRFFLVFYLEH